VEQISIVIPSHKRAERVSTTKIVEGAIICVPESQADQYQRNNQGIEIVAHPDTIRGLPAKLEWMRKYFGGSLFYLDDDVIDFRKLYAEKGEPPKVDNPTIVRELIEETAWKARKAKAYLFGFNHSPMPTAYSGFKPFELSGFVMGGATGLLSGSKLFWNVEMKLGGDFWISLLNVHYHRKIFKDMRFAFTFKDTFTNPGGLSEFRNVEAEKAKYEILRRYFGEAVRLKNDTHLAKRKHPWMCTMELPF
jgi:hypothetical protein